MAKIHVLPDQLVNQIAAGEVVERPASAVKELMENSIDAGSTKVEIEIRDGGRRLIRVVDDGSGMTQEDAQLCFQRHATSKIRNQEDLERISTLGFRGEALAAIASVAKVEMVTKAQGEEAGTSVKIEAGKILEVKDSPANPGTIVTVTDLFFSTPARRKFLKSVPSENRQIMDSVTNLALAHPHIGFKLTNETKVSLEVRENQSVLERLRDIFDEEQATELIHFSQTDSVVRITGYLGRPHLSQAKKSDLRIFVNGRSINSRTLLHAVTSAYGDNLIKGRFPVAVLFLELSFELVDVNVHPQKLEVRFWDDRLVHDLTFKAVKKALDGDFLSQLKAKSASTVGYQANANFSTLAAVGNAEYEHTAGQSILAYPRPESKEIVDFSLREIPQVLPFQKYYQLFNTYIMTQSENDLLIIDQHAAHERILFEEISHRIAKGEQATSQKLLFPQTVELDQRELAFFETLRANLEAIGFDLQALSGKTIMVSGVPAIFKNGSGSLLREVLRELLAQEKPHLDKALTLASALACRAAVKAGDQLSAVEMESIINRLMNLNTPQVCPHGRPVLIKIPVSELSRRFGRT